MSGKKIMLLGIAIILLGIACSTASNTLIFGGITVFVSRYAHWIGILVTIVGLFIKTDE